MPKLWSAQFSSSIVLMPCSTFSMKSTKFHSRTTSNCLNLKTVMITQNLKKKNNKSTIIQMIVKDPIWLIKILIKKKKWDLKKKRNKWGKVCWRIIMSLRLILNSMKEAMVKIALLVVKDLLQRERSQNHNPIILAVNRIQIKL